MNILRWTNWDELTKMNSLRWTYRDKLTKLNLPRQTSKFWWTYNEGLLKVWGDFNWISFAEFLKPIFPRFKVVSSKGSTFHHQEEKSKLFLLKTFSIDRSLCQKKFRLKNFDRFDPVDSSERSFCKVVDQKPTWSNMCQSFVPNDHMYIHTYVHTYIRTYIHTYIHTYVHTYIRTYIQHLNTLIITDRPLGHIWSHWIYV
jgi:hypothetical protein